MVQARTTTQLTNAPSIQTNGATLMPKAGASSCWADASPVALAALTDWVDASGDVVVGLDRDGRIVSANPAFDQCFAIGSHADRGDGALPTSPEPASSGARGDLLSRWVPLLTGPRLARWTSEIVGLPATRARVHRLLAEGLRADGERFLLSATLVRPRVDRTATIDAGGPGAQAGAMPALACIAALRTVDVPGSPADRSRRLREPVTPRLSGVAPDGVALHALVDAAIRSLPADDRRRRHEVALHAGAVVLAVDPDRIRHALVEVLENACRYTDSATPIRIAARIDEGEDGAVFVVITVADRGAGMSRADAQRTFEPFWRSASSAHLPGRGLGLAVARWLVDESGGWMELRSALGVGTEVDVWLPVVSD
jgi:anti-sigma regulatory factor (Ser/Thr protein kinase)